MKTKRLIVNIGKKNTAEKPCWNCGSTSWCDCALEPPKKYEISTADFLCPKCGAERYILEKCSKCGDPY